MRARLDPQSFADSISVAAAGRVAADLVAHLARETRLHVDQIRRSGSASGIRDLALLQSAIAMPESSYAGEFLHESVSKMAAAHLLHLARNHPFVDGNERTALI